MNFRGVYTKDDKDVLHVAVNESSCYYLSPNRRTFEAAYSDCEKRGGRMLALETEEEYEEFVTKHG